MKDKANAGFSKLYQPKMMFQSNRQLSFIFKRKTNETIVNNFFDSFEKLTKILAKITENVIKTWEVKITFTKL